MTDKIIEGDKKKENNNKLQIKFCDIYFIQKINVKKTFNRKRINFYLINMCYEKHTYNFE